MSVIESTFDINEFLTNAVKEGASDVHLRIGEVPVVRIDGKIVKIAHLVKVEAAE